MNQYIKDIFDQPVMIKEAIKSYMSDRNLEKFKEVSLRKYQNVIFSGMGGSHYACYASNISLVQNGFSSCVISAGELLYYEEKLVKEDSLLILVSQSGESAEILHLIKKIPATCTVAAITNNENSTLAKRGNYVFLMDVPPEEAVATRTYLSAIIILQLLATSLTGGSIQLCVESIDRAISSMEAFLSKDFEKVKTSIGKFIEHSKYLCLTGRGYSYTTVLAGGLFIREVGKFPCISIDSGEFRHGPFELIDQDFTGILVAPDGITYENHVKLARDIVDRGGKVLFITNRETSLVHERLLVIRLNEVEEIYSPLAEILPIQVVANHIAEFKGLEVGKFRWSSKVVETV